MRSEAITLTLAQADALLLLLRKLPIEQLAIYTEVQQYLAGLFTQTEEPACCPAPAVMASGTCSP